MTKIFTNEKAHPPSTKRFCLNCDKATTFKYNKFIFHSECSICGCRMVNHEKNEELKKEERCIIQSQIG